MPAAQEQMRRRAPQPLPVITRPVTKKPVRPTVAVKRQPAQPRFKEISPEKMLPVVRKSQEMVPRDMFPQIFYALGRAARGDIRKAKVGVA